MPGRNGCRVGWEQVIDQREGFLIVNRIRVSVLAAAAITAVASISVPMAAAKPKKPDLVIRGYKFTSSPAESHSRRFPFVVLDNDKRGPFELDFKVTNIGNKTAGKSTARIVANGPMTLGEEQVGPIKPGKSATVHGSYKPKFHGMGLFKVFACADLPDAVNESNEGNNCSKDTILRALPKRWDVSHFSRSYANVFTGNAPYFDTDSQGMKFNFYGPINDNGTELFLYLATGSVTEVISGADDGCSYTGTGTTTHSPWDVIEPIEGYMETDPQLDYYRTHVQDDDYQFAETTTCDGIPPGNNNFAVDPLDTYSDDYTEWRRIPDNAKTLAGLVAVPGPYGHDTTFDWSFKADLP